VICSGVFLTLLAGSGKLLAVYNLNSYVSRGVLWKTKSSAEMGILLPWNQNSVATVESLVMELFEFVFPVILKIGFKIGTALIAAQN